MLSPAFPSLVQEALQLSARAACLLQTETTKSSSTRLRTRKIAVGARRIAIMSFGKGDNAAHVAPPVVKGFAGRLAARCDCRMRSYACFQVGSAAVIRPCMHVFFSSSRTGPGHQFDVPVWMQDPQVV